jgi:urease accessory protein
VIPAHAVRRAGAWDGATDSVTLDHDGRQLRRRRLTTDAGHELHVDLPETVALNDGDALETDDGVLIAVRAADEPLVEVRAVDATGLARLAWHLGNRHLPVAAREGILLIRRDHVIEEMLAGLGAVLTPVNAPFEPEGGAYGHERTHGHDHHHGAAAAHEHG